MADIRWNENAGRFVGSNGRFISEATVRLVVDVIADHASERMAQLADRLVSGELSLGSFQAEMMREIKLSQLAATTIAHGGAEQMSFSRYGAAGQRIREQYDFLRDFAAEIKDGRQPLNGSVRSRAAQYGQASRVAFEQAYGRDQQGRGYRLEKNVLSAAEHCAQCRDQTGRGWVPIGTLVPIGSRACRGNDRCHLVYTRDAAQAA